MAGIAILLLFIAGGVFITHFWLPGLRPVIRWYAGAALGILLLMWLPVLWAYAVSFTVVAHLLAALTLCALVLLAYITRDHRPRVRYGTEDRRMLRAVLLVAVPLTLLAGYLQYTHSIRPTAEGTLTVGQSTYGDLSLHLAVATSIVNAKFPLHNSLMVGATMAYPYLADSFASTFYMLGWSLSGAMVLSGVLLCASVFFGYALLCAQLCRRRGAVWLAVLMLFINGGLGFFYTLSGTVENGVTTTLWDNLRTVMTGYYKTPTNQPDPYNLRWVNIICDMLIPQRGFLGGWSMLMPIFNLILPPLVLRRRPMARAWILAGIMAGGLPLLHTHSFLALGLCSIGLMMYVIVTAPKGRRMEAFAPFMIFGGIAVVLALPQLINFTFVQATESKHFLRMQFNWANNRGGQGLVEPYFWFYIKNIGLPYLLILMALLVRRKDGLRAEANRAAAMTDGLYLRESPEAAFAGVPEGQQGQSPEARAAEGAEAASPVLACEIVPLPSALQKANDDALQAALDEIAAEDAEQEQTPRSSVFEHDMPTYGRLHAPAETPLQKMDPPIPFKEPLPSDKLRAAAYAAEDGDRVGIMRAVTGTDREEASKRPLLEEIFHHTYRTGEVDHAHEAAKAAKVTDGMPQTCFADEPPARDWVRQHRMIALGAFLILLVAEFILFQPNEYDNNKLIYVWFMLCLPMAADYALEIFARLRGLGGRWLLGVLVCITLFLSAGLTIAREMVSDYQAYDANDIAVAEFVGQNTPEHSVVLTGTQHLNPIASLAGRTLVCGSDSYLYYHGFDTAVRQMELTEFYEAPAQHLDMLSRYGVRYVYVSPYEWNNYQVDVTTLYSLFTPVYASENGATLLFEVPEAYRKVEPEGNLTQTPQPTAAPLASPLIEG